MRLCPASAHHPSACRSLRPAPTPPPRGPGWAAAGFRANLFKREAAAGLERQGSAFLRQSTGRHACCNPIHGGSSTDTASDNPSGPPRPYLYPGNSIKPWGRNSPGDAPPAQGEGGRSARTFPRRKRHFWALPSQHSEASIFRSSVRSWTAGEAGEPVNYVTCPAAAAGRCAAMPPPPGTPPRPSPRPPPPLPCRAPPSLSAHRALAPSHPAGPSAARSLSPGGSPPRPLPWRRSQGGGRSPAPGGAERSGAERSGARAGTPRRRRGAPARPAGTTAPPAPAAPRLHRQPARRPHTKSQHSVNFPRLPAEEKRRGRGGGKGAGGGEAEGGGGRGMSGGRRESRRARRPARPRRRGGARSGERAARDGAGEAAAAPAAAAPAPSWADR